MKLELLPGECIEIENRRGQVLYVRRNSTTNVLEFTNAGGMMSNRWKTFIEVKA